MRFLHTLQGPRSSRGSILVEWIAVSVNLTFLFLSILQIGFFLHVKNTIIDSAAEGARMAGLLYATDIDGIELSRKLITSAISAEYARNISIRRTANTVTVEVVAPVPIIATMGIPNTLRLHARAPIELGLDHK